MKAWNYGVVTVNKTEIASKYAPEFREDFLPSWALRYTEEGQMEAEIVAEKLIGAAQASGAAFFEGNVTSIFKQDGRVAGVVLDGGKQLYADHVIVAAGLGSVELLAAENITLRKFPCNVAATMKAVLIFDSIDRESGFTRKYGPYKQDDHTNHRLYRRLAHTADR